MGKFLAYPCHHVNAYHVAAVDFSKEFEYMGLNDIEAGTMTNLFFVVPFRVERGWGRFYGIPIKSSFAKEDLLGHPSLLKGG